MNIYAIALFFHISGALGLSAALGLEWTSLRQIRNAVHPEQVWGWMKILKSTNMVGFACMLTTVLTGITMMLIAFSWTPWITVTIGSLVLMILLSVVVSRPRMAAIRQALAAGKGAVSEDFHRLVNQPMLWISIQTRAAIVLGIVFLKIAKPDLAGSLLTIAVALVLGVASALPATRRVRTQEGLAD